MMIEAIISMVRYLSPREDDDIADRMNYLYTPNLLLAFSVLISFKQFGGRPLECIFPSKFSGSLQEVGFYVKGEKLNRTFKTRILYSLKICHRILLFIILSCLTFLIDLLYTFLLYITFFSMPRTFVGRKILTLSSQMSMWPLSRTTKGTLLNGNSVIISGYPSFFSFKQLVSGFPHFYGSVCLLTQVNYYYYYCLQLDFKYIFVFNLEIGFSFDLHLKLFVIRFTFQMRLLF